MPTLLRLTNIIHNIESILKDKWTETLQIILKTICFTQVKEWTLYGKIMSQVHFDSLD